jgi:DNA-directed RNA polymerase subunit RPC12/RpoP
MSNDNKENVAEHYYKCRLCGAQFDSLDDRQRHELVDHIQKGEIFYKKEQATTNIGF